jgi:hypothetical protein
MGKSVTVINGFSNVRLPDVNPTGFKYFQGGQTVVLTDAEYAALPAGVLRALSASSNVAEPNRTGTTQSLTPVTNATATGAISIATGTNKLTLTGNVTGITTNGATAGSVFTYRLLLTQDATGSRLVTWPAKFKWVGGTAPTLSTGAGKTDIVEFVTIDGGTTIYAVGVFLDVR